MQDRSDIATPSVLEITKASVGSVQGDSEKYIDEINALQRRRGKPPLSAGDVLVRYMRMTGTEVMSHYVKLERPDLEKMVDQVPGMAVLIGHNYESAPVGTFFKAWVADEGENSYLDALFYVANDAEGQQLVRKIDMGVYNEASITWTYDKAICSICGRDYTGRVPDSDGEFCTHYRGEVYNGQTCYVHTTGDVKILEASIVYKGAHPNTKVGMLAAADRWGASVIDKIEEEKSMLKTREKEQAYVPRNPANYEKDESADWAKPALGDFLKVLGLDAGTRWSDIPKEQRSWISRHFAWAPSDDPDQYTFTDLKLPHHVPGDSYPKSIVKWGGVRAAAQRLPTSDIPESDMSEVQNHLANHYHEFGRKAPWERASAEWNEYARVIRELGSGYVSSDNLAEAKRLSEILFAEEDEMVELSVKLGEEVRTFKGSPDEVAEQIGEAIDEMVELMSKAKDEAVEEIKKEVETAKQQIEELNGLAELGKAYINDLVESIKEAFVAAEGADNLEGYEKMVAAMAEKGDVGALKAELKRLRAKLEATVPDHRLSRDPEDGPMAPVPPSEIEAYRQR